MKKKICPRPQCGKEYLDAESYNELSVCNLCGAPLEEVLVEDYNLDNDDTVEEVIENEADDVTLDECMPSEEDSYDESVDSEETFETTNCFVDIEEVNTCIKDESIISTEDTEVNLDVSEDTEENEAEEELGSIELDEEENSDEVEKADVVEDEDPYNDIKGNNLILYKDNEIFKVFELKYDETIVGRNSSEFTPDIDLQEVDSENAISRKHLLVYKEDDNYYIRNLSKKCSVHIKRYNESEPRVILFNESVIIGDGDFIVLSGKFILEAFFSEVEE